jgi:arsenate reductase (thioredoxin)
MSKFKVLVLCTGNSCRSQILHGYLRFFGADKLEVYSAGVEVHGLNPIAVGIMAQDGVNIMQHTSNHIDEYRDISFDFVITVCDNARETCPWFPSNAKLIHHSFNDPAAAKGSIKEILSEFRKVRDEIKDFARQFVSELG